MPARSMSRDPQIWLWRHFPLWIGLAMALVIIINVVMMWQAFATFPGQPKSNGYDASNAYNGILDKAAQEAGQRPGHDQAVAVHRRREQPGAAQAEDVRGPADGVVAGLRGHQHQVGRHPVAPSLGRRRAPGRAALPRHAPVDQLQLQQAAVVVGVPGQLDREVDRHPGRRQPPRHFPGNSVQAAAAAIVEPEPEMLLLEDRGRRT